MYDLLKLQIFSSTLFFYKNVKFNNKYNSNNRINNNINRNIIEILEQKIKSLF